MGGARFQKKDLGENDLVVELLELFEEGIRHGESLAIILRIDVAGGKSQRFLVVGLTGQQA